jgi:predicted AAA+ superfamily ATPase
VAVPAVLSCTNQHALLGVRTESELLAHPKGGASWEGYAVEEILKVVEPDEAYFWATHQGAELDLLLFKGGRRFGVEIKRMDAPTLTSSMRIALADLQLEHLMVVYPGRQSYELGPEVTVLPIDTAVAAGIDSLTPKRRSRVRVTRV